MAAIASSLVSVNGPYLQRNSGNALKMSEKCFVICHPLGLSSAPLRRKSAGVAIPKRRCILRASYREGGRSSTASSFIGGFLLGGMMVGTLACVYAPQVQSDLFFVSYHLHFDMFHVWMTQLQHNMQILYHIPLIMISKALAGTDKKELMRKLPKFIYDEEKALEKTRKVLTQKIDELNLAIDEVSSQIHANDKPNGVAVSPDEIEAAI
ncbi:hypothetical protein ZIOFF_016406 [Zingiber officinale]|uniref:Uncharacterized protein n=1 Tax=Zingiber officinale TaxID=94328 RepID=A0A8J5HLM8_ZINOF|nr:hypothetical protein ZIOFF_016406 [Zingiber officinale]